MSRRVAVSAWLQRKHWPKRTTATSQIRFADVFSGCGGLSLGTIHALASRKFGWQVSFAADLSSAAKAVYTNNFAIESRSFFGGDIRQIFPGAIGDAATDSEKKFAEAFKPLQLLIAGPPCQGHSDLNNRSRRSDSRNLLYLRALRAVEILEPTACLIENVPMVVHDKHRVLEIAHRTLESLGYFCVEIEVNALAAGLPQRRKRHMFVASKIGKFELPRSLAGTPNPPPTLRDAIADIEEEWLHSQSAFRTASVPTKISQERIEYLFRNNLFDLPNKQRPDCHRLNSHSYRSVYGRLHWDRPAQTITGGFGCMGQGRFVHPSQRRTITPHEAARIQGFPDFFSFDAIRSRTALQEIIGNAVPPLLASVVVGAMLDQRLLGNTK